MQTVISNILKFKVSVEDLSKRSGISLNRITDILRGNDDPLISEVRAIAKALKVRPEFLLSDNETYQTVNALFRSNITDKNDAIFDKISYLLSNALSILGNDKPKNILNEVFPKVDNTYEGIINISTVFRQVYCNSDFISPLLNLPEIIANELNCVLMISEIGNSIDGVSAILNDVPFIIIAPRFKPRMLFTLAHELGHLIAHHTDSDNYATADSSFKMKKRRSGEEVFAHHFASEILLPQEGVAYTLKRIRELLAISGDHFGEIELLYLSRIYGVSFEVAALRCENLGIIPRGSAASLYESLVKEFKGPEKRAEQLGIQERQEIYFPSVSSNLMQPIVNKINTGELSLGKAAELLSIPTSDIINYNSQDGGYSLR
ncbi:ImmA/IrrE family metallo-endopeptidase [Mucilaginibacter sp. OK283]|uniref:helix-turn-helix domain-containing protein n=1 Tax=Mucilaginibacter sp. OK283 TaxID=1881049 RepID=UPI0008D2BD33|nr:XRE family transcriptional regulator [Mucilaginibacter sp. OK283]SEO14086.1 Zn-dependent peptidase ImmA, M78 family [Mucilaginibacter sp. OK283]